MLEKKNGRRSPPWGLSKEIRRLKSREISTTADAEEIGVYHSYDLYTAEADNYFKLKKITL